jgi:hypothetical protein
MRAIIRLSIKIFIFLQCTKQVMSVKLPVFITIIVLTPILLTSCKNRDFKDINEGEIHYSITYGGPAGMIPRELMPKNLIVSFKRDKILFDIYSPIGNSGIANLANHEKKLYDTYVNMIGGRYYYEGEPEEVPPGLLLMEGMEIDKTGKTGEILGFNCIHAEVRLESMPDSVFEIWYTDEIDIKEPNAATPFREIDGVLLKFFFFMGEREFIFEAEGIYRKEIPEKVFFRREKYRRVSKEAINDYILMLVNL